jgi:hypothetical protein
MRRARTAVRPTHDHVDRSILLRKRALSHGGFLKYIRGLATCLALFEGATSTLRAQSAYANTESGRPLRTEDAYVIERYRLDADVGPVTWQQSRKDGSWVVNPELIYGILPRTQVQLAVPFGGRTANQGSVGVNDVELSATYALNVETRSFPAFAVRGRGLIPVGDFGVRAGHTSLAAIATRSFGWGRLSVNHEYTFGDEPPGSAAADPRFVAATVSRWWTGAAVDRALPLRGLLVGLEVFARQPLATGSHPRWNAGAGVRYQLTNATVIDLGGGATFAGDDPSGMLTIGIARSVAVGNLFPGIGGWGR